MELVLCGGRAQTTSLRAEKKLTKSEGKKGEKAKSEAANNDKCLCCESRTRTLSAKQIHNNVQ